MDTSFSPCRMNHGIGDPAAEENVPRALLVTWRGGPITNHLDIFFFVCGCTVATAGLLGVVFPCSGGSVRARGEPVTALSPPPPRHRAGQVRCDAPVHSLLRHCAWPAGRAAPVTPARHRWAWRLGQGALVPRRTPTPRDRTEQTLRTGAVSYVPSAPTLSTRSSPPASHRSYVRVWEESSALLASSGVTLECGAKEAEVKTCNLSSTRMGPKASGKRVPPRPTSGAAPAARGNWGREIKNTRRLN